MVSISALTIYLLGLQIRLKDLAAFRRGVNYKCQKPQWLTLCCAIALLCLVIVDFNESSLEVLLPVSVLFFGGGIIQEWLLAKINSSNVVFNYLIRFLFVAFLSFVLTRQIDGFMSLPFCLMGLYMANCPFGVVQGKTLRLAHYLRRYTPIIPTTSITHVPDKIPNFGNAGNKKELNNLTKYDVTKNGIIPNTGEDLTHKVQDLIDKIGRTGGGVIYFPRGRYLFGNKIKGAFLQINYSNVSLEGEIGKNGEPIAELICCSSTLKGKRNPWLSPFFITTGESLQQSNMFWGLQFKKRKKIVTRSGSLADPGSDGNILTPTYATSVVKTSEKGESLLEVESTESIGKYILLGMYNTTEDGNLIRELLGTEDLRPEWKTPLRAGGEVAPSYQWLVEVESIVDEHTIKLVQPLWRDCDIKYKPEIYNVNMLENISIRNLRLSSKWNGLFRHHGFPLYYSVHQSQEMDYGWNAINMKRVAHGSVGNMIIKDFTNPLYVMDSRNITCENLKICGHDGHQGIKIYEHACDNLFRNITFMNHYADMLGGEGNAYGNVFTKIRYLNPCYKPVDFDFHGFSEGPMSPPSNNLFDCIQGFRWIKTAAAIYNLPGCATGNIWWNIDGEGEPKGTPLFICLPHVGKGRFGRVLSSISRAIITVMQTRSISPGLIWGAFLRRMEELTNMAIPVKEHQKLYHQVKLFNYNTWSEVSPQSDIEISKSELYKTSLFDYFRRKN